MTTALLVGLGGFIGSILRYFVGLLITKNIISNFPLSTLTINIVGSFFIGVMLALGPTRINHPAYFLLVPGLLGGFTTYSAFSGEAVQLLKNNQVGLALIYLLFTVIGGLLAAWLGMSTVSGFDN